MSFTSWQYPFLLIITCLLYWRLEQKKRIFLILISSYVFYGSWDVRFLSLIIASTAIDYMGSLAIRGRKLPFIEVTAIIALPLMWLIGVRAFAPMFHFNVLVPQLTITLAAIGVPIYVIGYMILFRLHEEIRPKAFLIFSICSNLTILGFFKYFHFFSDSLRTLLSTLGFHPGWFTLEILLPVGISFYTFQSLSYVVDVYYKKGEYCDDLPTFAAYLSFFPQLVAGPIERSKHLLPQIRDERTFDPIQIQQGVRLILVGLFLKIFVADNCALLANYAFNLKTPLNGYWSLIGILSFTFQIYGDFAGYTSIARGSAQLFGVNLMRNFAFPYFSRGPSDFWGRWHISLSSWFRDYVYIPLGGNRGTKSRMLINLMITMFLAGLWHGASWMFVIWGVYHGLLLVIYRVTSLHKLEDSTKPYLVATSIVLMFVLAAFGWSFFRASSPENYIYWISGFANWNASGMVAWKGPAIWLIAHVLPLLLLQALTWTKREESELDHLHWSLRAAIYLLLVLLVCSSSSSDQEFIYFQF